MPNLVVQLIIAGAAMPQKFLTLVSGACENPFKQRPHLRPPLGRHRRWSLL
jgi:hypothetical protein